MNRRFNSRILRNSVWVLVLLSISFTACKKDKSLRTASVTEVNQWVTDSMEFYYYWNESIPARSDLRFSLEPTLFFNTLRNPADRFSWIAKADELEDNLSGVSTSTGMDFFLVEYDCRANGQCALFGAVRSVIPGSPAAQAGVERGMIFSGVNGRSMNSENYRSILEPYTRGEGFSMDLATLNGNILTPANRSISLNAARVADPSVHFSKVINTASGRKVGYLYYNRFLNEKAGELFRVFNDFRASGVNELVLDLRYNPGGGIAVSGLLAALIKQNYSKDQLFVQYDYNDILNAAIPANQRNKTFASLFVPLASNKDEKAAVAEMDRKVKAANLNLPTVYILATEASASASELVIHNLAPYMEVVHIGETTVGKNEGSTTIKDERNPPRIDWAIQPIIVKLADKNGKGDYDSGLSPNHEVDEFSVLPLLPHGSEEDPLIAKALTLIDPSMATRGGIAKSMTAQKRQRSEGTSFKAFEPFERQKEYFPVQLDGTIDKDQLKRLGTP